MINELEHFNRIELLINYWQKLNPEIRIDSQSKIKNATIEKICWSDEAFQRMTNWCEDRLKEKEQARLKEEGDINQFREVLNEAYQILKGRNEKYGDSWKVLTIQGLANLGEMKLHRISNLGEDAKTYDEFIDTINYCIFGIIKLKNKK